jgi:hypothetical protein
LDIQVRPVALTAEQVRRYELPRNAIKESNRQAVEFQRKYGAGATELDALESVHPGELGRVVEAEIARYVDRDLDERIEAAEEEAQESLDEITREVVAEHSVDELRAQHRELASEINSAISAFEQEINGRFRARIDSLAERSNGLFHGMTVSLEARAPDSDDFDWPEPAEGNEDEDALFDSTRDYVAQIDRLKKHQQKPTERKARGNGGALLAK